MQEASKEGNIAALDAFTNLGDGPKMRLVEPRAIAESVQYLRIHGFDADEIERCLVRYFHVDLDVLSEALTRH